MKRTALFVVLSVSASLLSATPWTYRGTLNDGGRPANGHYDLRLTLIDEAGTRSITQPITLFNVQVKDGNFSTDVDFGLDLARAPAMKLKTEVAQGGSAFASIGEPTRFDPKAALAGICWDTTGNVVAAGEFLGSTNNVPLEIKANNQRVARFSPGLSNMASVVLGSSANVVTGSGATIGGGGSSAMTCGSGSSSCANQTDETFATISGGAGNSIVGTTSTIGGGNANTISGSYATIGGGGRNSVGFSAGFGTVAGGSGNSVSGQYGAVSGGDNNGASGNWSIAAGGQSNAASGGHSVVSGGSGGTASGSAGTIAGGLFNSATGSRSTTAGGESGTASGAYSFVAGGFFNCAGGQSSFAGGRRAKTRPGTNSGGVGEGCSGVSASGTAEGDAGSFVWADAQDTNHVSTGPNQFMVRAGGGVVFNSNTAPSSSEDMIIGARAAITGGDSDADVVWLSRSGKTGTIYLTDSTGGFIVSLPNLTASSNRLTVSGGTGGTASLSNGGTWTNASSRSFKEGFVAVDPLQILAKVAALPITTWTYKQSAEGSHMGPMAEDFKASFGLAGDGKSIGTVDADGVALAAIQGLNQKLEQAQAENQALKTRLEAIEALLAK
jgi:trimeric autotransporter adhesin